MKVILSRKGFDSASGGHPSPILPDGTLLSIPIPAKDDIRYTDLVATDNRLYYDIMSQLFPIIKINGKTRPLDKKFQCHLDPDLSFKTYPRENGWKPLFGQTGASLSHLRNNNVQSGDIFLFYGLFRKTIDFQGKLVFDNSSEPIHVIFGFLQIGKIYEINLEFNVSKWMLYHPHVLNKSLRNNSVIYESARTFSENRKIPGAGIFKFHPSLILTKEGLSASKWKLPDFLKNINISYHSNSNKYGWKNEYFQSAYRGQEFIIEEDKRVLEWVIPIIENNLNIFPY